jgi:hypothetical protein
MAGVRENSRKGTTDVLTPIKNEINWKSININELLLIFPPACKINLFQVSEQPYFSNLKNCSHAIQFMISLQLLYANKFYKNNDTGI